MTIEFAKLGVPLKDKTLQVYLRYQYKNVYTGDNTYEYIPTGQYLSIPDMESLLSDRLGGKTYFDLQKYKEEMKLKIDEYFSSTGNYPTKAWVVKREQQEKKTVVNYIDDYKNERRTKIKSSSLSTQQAMIESMLLAFTKIKEEERKSYIDDIKIFAAEATTKKLEEYLVAKEHANGYIRPLMLLLIRIQNSVREKIGLGEIKYSLVHLKSNYKKYMLTKDEINYLLNFKTDKETYKETQLLIRLNKVIGLRIDELLGIEVSDIHFKKDHLLIYMGEDKKGRARNLPIDFDGNEKLIDELKRKIKKVKEGRLFYETNKDDVNYRLKAIARLSGKFDDVVLIVNNIGVEANKERKHKYELISSHSLRKFAVTDNAKKHGLVVAQYYSGHEDLQTLKKHYLGEATPEEILEMVRSNKTS